MFVREDENSPKNILLSDKCIERGLFSRHALLKAFKEQKSGTKNHSRYLFRMLSVELWFREFIDNN
jgi:asparagine synthase (glutamine-hydrolysing)